MQCHNSLRSWRYCLGARLKVWLRSRDPKKGVGKRRWNTAVFLFLAAYSRCDGLAAKSHSPTTQYHQLRKLIPQFWCAQKAFEHWTARACTCQTDWFCTGMLHIYMVVAYNTARTVSKTRSLMQVVFPRDTKWLVLLFSGFLPWLERQEYEGLSVRHHSPSGNPGLEINESTTVEGKRSDSS